MNDYTFNMQRALNLYPEHSSHILQDMERIKQLSTECGCSMGAKFMLVSTGIVGIYIVFFNKFVFPKILMDILIGFTIIFVSSMIGKMLGIGLAKLRLTQLYRSLQSKYPIQGE